MGAKNEITKQLSGVELPAVALASCSLSLADANGTELLLSIGANGQNAPVFVRESQKTGELFFLAAMNSSDAPRKIAGGQLPDIFSEIAPELMFVRYAAGEKGWHHPEHYANLTIDDALLTEPYGHLNYEVLLGEMEKHNFHTTVAFIPLNFGRNKPEMISLFRGHPGRFSISIHGNNHDHREFGDYGTSPLAEQEWNIRQALARMEKFKALTGIPYDRVMIFPHGIAPSETFAALKKYNFLATANSEYIPLGASAPDDALFFLRPMTLRYSGFTSLLRYSAEIPVPPAVIAIHLFLDNPVLFYGHEMLFDEGIDSFNGIAGEVNLREPDIHWCGMQCVAEHLYLQRLREDGGVDVRAFASTLTLENELPRESQFWVVKQEDVQPEIVSLTVDGQLQPFARKDGEIAFHVSVPARGDRRISIIYRNDLDLASIAVSPKNPYVLLVRRMAEFRDMTLSTWPAGRHMTKFYYKHNLDAYEVNFERFAPFVFLAAILAGIAKYVQKKARPKNAANV